MKGFPEEDAFDLITRLFSYVAPGSGTTHARLVVQIWGEAAVTPEVAIITRVRHEELQARLTTLLNGSADTGQVVLAALIGYAAIVATDIPVDTAKFIRSVARLL